MRSNVAVGWFFLCKVTDNCKILTFSPRKIIDSTLTQAVSSWPNSDSNDYQHDSTLTRLISLIFTIDSTLTRLIWVRVESNLTQDSWVEHNPGSYMLQLYVTFTDRDGTCKMPMTKITSIFVSISGIVIDLEYPDCKRNKPGRQVMFRYSVLREFRDAFIGHEMRMPTTKYNEYWVGRESEKPSVRCHNVSDARLGKQMSPWEVWDLISRNAPESPWQCKTYLYRNEEYCMRPTSHGKLIWLTLAHRLAWRYQNTRTFD